LGGAPLNSIGFTGVAPCPCPCPCPCVATCVVEDRGVGDPRRLPGLDVEGDEEVEEDEELLLLLDESCGPKIFSLAAL